MVDFATLNAFPSVFADMSDADTKRVVRAVHSSVLEGRELTVEEMQMSADRILNRRPGGLTDADVRSMLAENGSFSSRSTSDTHRPGPRRLA